MRLRLVLCSVALLKVAVSARGAETCTLPDVLLARAGIREDSAAFTQERRIRYVTEPITSAGRLRYAAPDRLEMIVEEPRQERFLYEDGVLTIDTADAEAERRISVESNVVLATMLSGLIGILSGDGAELRRLFFVDFEDTACEWRLELVPKSKRVIEKVDKINVSGERQRIRRVEIRQSNGDTSILTLKAQE
jgi:hypothetical protein